MPKTILTLLGCSLFAVQLSADPITYVATTATMRGFIGTDIFAAASAPGFLFTGGRSGISFTGFGVGEQVPLDITIFASPDGGATVDFGGIVQPTNDLAGTFEVTSPGSFVIPPNPNLTYTFAAQATGQITALPAVCMSPGEELPPGVGPFPLCGTSAVLSIDLPGELTVQLLPVRPDFPNVFYVDEIFTSAPEPSSAALFVVATCAGAVLALRKRKRDNCTR